MSMQVLRPAVGANSARWDGEKPGHYEAWYLTLSDPDSGRGFWFRYTFEVPKDRAREPVAELWAFAFTPGRPPVGGKHTVPLEFPPRGVMHVGDAVLEHGRAVGEVDGISWDLQWRPSATALWHIPAWPGRSTIPSTRVVSPTVDALFEGEVVVGGETVPLNGALGCQTHLWGRQHAARWTWGHCNAFAERDDVLLEAIHAVPLLGASGRPAPVGFTLLYVEIGGEPLPCNAFPWVLGARSRVDSPRWEMRGRTGRAKVRAVLEADLDGMAQVTYEDPDGSKAWCVNSEIARCALEVEWASGSFDRYTSDGLAHVEFGDRRLDPRVPVLC